MKTASLAGPKWQVRAGAAGQDYATGANSTQKDQAANAIAAKAIYQAALTASFAAGSYEKGLGRSGKAGWLQGIVQKGIQNYQTGVSTAKALTKYVTHSGMFDAARGAASSAPRGPKGSPQNLQRVTLVANALHAAKQGK